MNLSNTIKNELSFTEYILIDFNCTFYVKISFYIYNLLLFLWLTNINRKQTCFRTRHTFRFNILYINLNLLNITQNKHLYRLQLSLHNFFTQPGETWQPSPCTNCQCTGSYTHQESGCLNHECFETTCDVYCPPCHELVYEEGRCCGVCKATGCSVNKECKDVSLCNNKRKNKILLIENVKNSIFYLKSLQ